MLKLLTDCLRHFVKTAKTTPLRSIPHPIRGSGETLPAAQLTLQQTPLYDESLLDRSRTQWQFGDWETLTNLTREILQQHPERNKLALLAAAGHFQTGDMDKTRLFIRLAIDWGCSKKLVSQMLIAGVHNTLGLIAALDEDQQRSIKHFESSVRVGSPNSDISLITKARATFQLSQMPLKLNSLQIET